MAPMCEPHSSVAAVLRFRVEAVLSVSKPSIEGDDRLFDEQTPSDILTPNLLSSFSVDHFFNYVHAPITAPVFSPDPSASPAHPHFAP